MSSVRPPLASNAAAAGLQLEFAGELGRLLAAARQERGLSIEDVSLTLLLSTRQVRALEAADTSAFHSAAFFVRGLKKYVELIGVANVPDALFERLMQASPAGAELRRAADANLPSASGLRVAPLALGGIGVVALAALGVGFFMERARAPGPPPVTAAAVTAAGAALPAVTLAPLAAFRAAADQDPASTPDTPLPADIGSLTAPTATWVFVRYVNNEVVERRLEANERLRFAATPVFVAVGLEEGVRLELGGQLVDLRPFAGNGQIRIGRAELASMMPR